MKEKAMRYWPFPDPKLSDLNFEVEERLIRVGQLLTGDLSRSVSSTNETVYMVAPPIIGTCDGSSPHILNAKLISPILEQLSAEQYVKAYWYQAPDECALDLVQFTTVELVLSRERALEYLVDRPRRLSIRQYWELEQQRNGPKGKRCATHYSGWQEVVAMLRHSPALSQSLADWVFGKEELEDDDYGILISWRVGRQRIRQFLNELDHREGAAA